MILIRSIFIAIVLLISTNSLLAGNPPGIKPDTLEGKNFNFEPDKDAKEAVYNIVKYTGLQPNFIVVEKNDVKTASAYISSGKRYIAYNRLFIYKLRNKSKTDWAAVSVLAHEIGHHLLGHTLKYKNLGPGDELAADRFSGFILFQMGATVNEAKAALNTVGHEIDTLNHPTIDIRIQALVNGWNEAYSLKNTTAYSAQATSNLVSERIEYLFKFEYKNDQNTYFLDGKDRIIWHDNYGNPIVIGTKLETENTNYAWMYSYKNQVFGVDYKGNIWLETSHGYPFIVGQVFEIINE